LNHAKFSRGQSKVLSECDVDPMVYSRMVTGSQMKHRVLWVYCTSHVHDYAYVWATKFHHIHIATLWTCIIPYTSNIVVASILIYST
jgi:hypothetical protein